jgi:hypothetical protein
MKEIALFVLAIILGGLLVHYLEPAHIEVRTVTKIDSGKEIRVMRAWPNTPEGNRERMDFMRDHPNEKCRTVRVPSSYLDHPNPFCYQ